jgi:hypothetical protein
MDLSQTSRHTPSTELQRRLVEAYRNQRRLERYRNIRLYQHAVRIVETLNRAHR